jgi:hypothetical protein
MTPAPKAAVNSFSNWYSFKRKKRWQDFIRRVFMVANLLDHTDLSMPE